MTQRKENPMKPIHDHRRFGSQRDPNSENSLRTARWLAEYAARDAALASLPRVHRVACWRCGARVEGEGRCCG